MVFHKEEFRIRSPPRPVVDVAQDATAHADLPGRTDALRHRLLDFQQSRRLRRAALAPQPSPASRTDPCAGLVPASPVHVGQPRYHRLAAEDDEGSVEYKWRLTDITPDRFEHLVTQMQFRVSEGHGQCLYELGVADDGVPRGLPADAFEASVATVHRMAAALGLDCRLVERGVVRHGPEPLYCGELLISRRRARPPDLSLAFCGSTGCGKSTLMATLLTGARDDGHGGARQALFNHKHEVSSGHTSSIATRLWTVPVSAALEAAGGSAALSDALPTPPSLSSLRSGSDGRTSPPLALPVESPAPTANRPAVTAAALPESARLISLVDAGGDLTKTSLFALMSRRPDYVCLCVAADGPTAGVALYARLCAAIGLPFLIALTRCDVLAEFELDSCTMDIAATLQAAGCGCDVVESEAQALAYCQTLPRPASGQGSGRASEKGGHEERPRQPRAPLVCVSSVTGAGLDLLAFTIRHLRPLPPPPLPLPLSEPSPPATGAPFEVLLDKTFAVQGVGPVMLGRVAAGSVEAGCACYMGPDDDGAFFPVTILGIHVDGAHVNEVQAGAEATFAVSAVPASVDLARKGKVLVRWPASVCATVRARVQVLAQTLTPPLEPILFSRNVRQAVRVLACRPCAGEQRERAQEWEVDCAFLFRPEVLAPGAPLALRWDPGGLAVGSVVQHEGSGHTAPPPQALPLVGPDC